MTFELKSCSTNVKTIIGFSLASMLLGNAGKSQNFWPQKSERNKRSIEVCWEEVENKLPAINSCTTTTTVSKLFEFLCHFKASF